MVMVREPSYKGRFGRILKVYSVIKCISLYTLLVHVIESIYNDQRGIETWHGNGIKERSSDRSHEQSYRAHE